MTTAYTSLLGLALPVTGELSGTWGDTVNNSITSLLDAAIAGTTTLSSDADVTLSNNDGTADTSRQAILLWTAGGTVTRTVIAPALSKIYTVINASSSTQSIKVTGPGPTTGVTIVKGESALIAWNGSDFVKVSNSGGSFTTQDLTVTGNTILGDAITDTTTLNAQTRFQSRAILGYSNMTGPAATSLSTTAPAFLYSGATTYTVSDVSGGTQTHAPIISLGQATITNASTNTIYTNAQTLYIGGAPNASTNVTFTRPYALYLDSGTTASATTVTYTNAATLYIAGAPTAGANVTLTDPLALSVAAGTSYFAGNVGIGTSNPSTQLEIKSAVFTDSQITLDNTSANTTSRVLFKAAGTEYGRISGDSTQVTLQSGNIPINFRTNSGLRMTLDASGNLGIGNTSPASYNAAADNLVIGTSGSNGLTIVSGTTNDGSIHFADGTSGADAYRGQIFYSHAANYMVFSTDATERARIDSSGNVGIGASTSNGKLTIKNPSSSGAQTILRIQSATNTLDLGGLSFNQSTDEFKLEAITSAGFLTFGTGSGGTERMRIDSSGNLGLGVTPSAWSNAYKSIEIGTVGNSVYGGASSNSEVGMVSAAYYNSGWKYSNTGSKPIRFSMNDVVTGQCEWYTAASGTAGNAITFTQAMTLDASGRLLVGRTSGSYPLDVTGSGGRFTSATGIETAIEFAPGVALIGTLTNHPLTFGTNNTVRARIDTSGNLLVGKTSTSATVAGFLVESQGDTYITVEGVEGKVLYLNRLTSDGDIVLFAQANTTEGSISVSGTTVSYNGGHLSRWAQTTAPKDDTLVKGTVLSNLDAMNVYTDADGVPVANEQLNKVKISDAEGDVNVAGVFVNWTHDEAHNVDEINMAMTGDMIIRIAQGVTVARGDLLMSAGDGTAKPQGDDIVRSKTVAKVTSTHVTCTYEDGSYCVPCVLMAC